MTRIAFGADVHVGNHQTHKGEYVAGLNERCRQVIDVLGQAVQLAHDEECSAFVVAGDLFDRVNPTPQMVSAVQDAIDKGVDFHAVLGNHDSASAARGDHALGPLLPLGYVWERPRVVAVGDVDLVVVPYQPGPADDWFPEVVDGLIGKKATTPFRDGAVRLMSFHLGIEDGSTDVWLKGSHDSVHIDLVESLMEEYGIRAVFAGNWHDHRHWSVLDGKADVVQCGALCPTGFNNYGVEGYGNVCFFDTEGEPAIYFQEIPGPRFLKVSGPKAKSLVDSTRRAGNIVYVKWMTEVDAVTHSQGVIDQWIEEGICKAGRALPDKEDLEAAAREAAEAASEADSLDEAVVEYVEKRFDDSYDKPLIVAQSLDLLNGGAS
jgi:DNA repair exonuclease SbcCD nuclease subunit